MKENRRAFLLELTSQILVLLLLGSGSIWVLKHRADLDAFGPLTFLRFLPWLLLVLYFWLCYTVLRSLFSNYFLKRYDPADPKSLAELAAIRRYHIAGKRSGTDDPSLVIRRLLRALKETRAAEIARHEFGIVYERPATTPFRGLLGHSERWIFNYKPMLNVLIADRYLSEASRFISESRKAHARRNVMLLISDMDNDTEILSSAAGVVNFLGRVNSKSLLMPFLLDVRHNRLFFPQDLSALSLGDRLYYQKQRELILHCLGALPGAAETTKSSAAADKKRDDGFPAFPGKEKTGKAAPLPAPDRPDSPPRSQPPRHQALPPKNGEGFRTARGPRA